MDASAISYSRGTLGTSLLRSWNQREPTQLDSKDPTGNFHDFLMGEVRYASLVKSFPRRSQETPCKA